jgi:hypothetical protein
MHLSNFLLEQLAAPDGARTRARGSWLPLLASCFDFPSDETEVRAQGP